jgi:hypothetical protein
VWCFTSTKLTAKVYTDVPALGLHDEIAKLPWISDGDQGTQLRTQKSDISSPVASLADILRQLQVLSEATGTEGISHFSAPGGVSGQILEMATRAGIEPAVAFLQAAIEASSCGSGFEGCAQRDALVLGELAVLIENWTKLLPEIRSAILTLVRSAKGGLKWGY